MINTSYYLYGGIALFVASIATMLTLLKEVKSIKENSDKIIILNFDAFTSENLKANSDTTNLLKYLNIICNERNKQAHLIEDVKKWTFCSIFASFILILIGLLPQTNNNGIINLSEYTVNSIISVGSAIVAMLFLVALIVVAHIVQEFLKIDGIDNL